MKRPLLLESWPGIWEKWARNYCRQNFWRVQHSLGSMEDAMAECALLFVDCQRRYGRTVNAAPQFMHLYQMMVKSRFNKLSNKDTGARTLEQSCELTEMVPERLTIDVQRHEATSELREVLQILHDAPSETLETIFGDATVLFKKFSVFLGIDKSKRLADELKVLLH
jgi:hypothetical protein